MGEEAALKISRREIYRYLGFGKETPDEKLRQKIEGCVSLLEEAASPRFYARSFPLQAGPGSKLDFSCAQTESEDLARNLSGCETVIFFAATLGAETDRLLRRYELLEMSSAVILQAAGAAMIEALCDRENERLREEYRAKGYYLRPRFSPGYGDFPLEFQRELLRILEADKRLGITLTDSILMIPSKSVTALIGAGRELESTAAHSCRTCQKADCAYERPC